MPKTQLSRLQRLEEKRNQLERQIKDAKAKQAARLRKDDTRRKIIAGSLALTHMEKNPASDFARQLTRLMEQYVTKPNERALMGLKPATNDDGGALSNTFHEQSPAHQQS